MHCGEWAGGLRLRAVALEYWHQVTKSLHRLREGCDALCWERQRSLARRMLRAWGAWAGGQALLDGRAGAAAAAADIDQHMKAARATGGVAAMAEAAAAAAAKTQPVVHCFLTSLGEPRVVATHHHPPSVALAGQHIWTAVAPDTDAELSIHYHTTSKHLAFKRRLPRAMRKAVLALPVRCWHEWTVVRRKAVYDRSIAKAHGDVIRVFCALRAWARQHNQHQHQQQSDADHWPQQKDIAVVRRRDRVEAGAERVWYIFWRNRMRCELQLQFVTRHEWDVFWNHVPRDVQI